MKPKIRRTCFWHIDDFIVVACSYILLRFFIRKVKTHNNGILIKRIYVKSDGHNSLQPSVIVSSLTRNKDPNTIYHVKLAL